MNIVVIAGGTGLIGSQLTHHLRTNGMEVRVLSRSPKKEGEYHWNPKNDEIDLKAFEGVTHIVNLTGASISDHRWTDERKKLLYNSRIGTTEFLYKYAKGLTSLKKYISASGINCYGYNHPKREHLEDDPFGEDYLSQLVKAWEESADLFNTSCQVVKMRCAVVLSTEGGALDQMLKPINLGLGAALGSGKQLMPWIHIEDLVSAYTFAITSNMHGAYNVVAACDTNEKITNTLARVNDRKIILPNIPEFLLKLRFGEMASILIESMNASNEKLLRDGFTFNYKTIEEALNQLFDK